MPFFSVSLRSLTHDALRCVLMPGTTALDGTAGNGHDTFFLAQCVGAEGFVYGFDVQEAALNATRHRLEEAGMCERVRLFLAGHETLDQLLPMGTQLHGAIFNLGYLPGSPKTMTTRPETSVAAAKQALSRLVSGGVLALHMYAGHAGGDEECAAVLAWAHTLVYSRWQVLHIATLNKELRPEHALLIVAR